MIEVPIAEFRGHCRFAAPCRICSLLHRYESAFRSLEFPDGREQLVPVSRELPRETVFQALWASGFTLPTHVGAPVAAGNLSAPQVVEPGRRERAAAISVPFKGCDCCYSLHRNGRAVAISIDWGEGTSPPDFTSVLYVLSSLHKYIKCFWVRLKDSRNLIIELIILAFYEGERWVQLGASCPDCCRCCLISVTARGAELFAGLGRRTLRDRKLEGAERKTTIKCHRSVFFFETVNYI